jgi:hypothetical protein
MAMVNAFRARQKYWKIAAAVGLILVLVSLVLLAYAFSPDGEPLRLQATLAPTLFAPLPGGTP